MDITAQESADIAVFCKVKIQDGVVETVYSLQIKGDFTWDLHVRNEHLGASTPLALLLPSVSSASEVEELIRLVESCTICIDNPDDKYAPLVSSRKGMFLDSTGRKTERFH